MNADVLDVVRTRQGLNERLVISRSNARPVREAVQLSQVDAEMFG